MKTPITDRLERSITKYLPATKTEKAALRTCRKLEREAMRLRKALEEIIADEWRVCCDYGPREDRDAILKRAENILSNTEVSHGGAEKGTHE